MAALRGRRLLGALAVLVRHFGRRARPGGRLYAGYREANGESSGWQPATTATTGRDELVVLQELCLVLRHQERQNVESRGVRARRRKIGERS